MRIGWYVDGVAGKLSRLLHAVRGAEHNTIDDLPRYLDLPSKELFPAPERVPLVRRRTPLLERSRVTETLTFASEHVPLCPRYRLRHDRDYAVNHTVHGRWMHPRRTQRKSLLIYVHGWLEPGPFVEETTLLPRIYRDLEVDVAHVQLPFHGKRNPKGALFHGEFYWSADLVRSIEALRQSVIDVRAAMLWFRTLGYQQIGVSGISLGGSIAMLLACLDPTPEYIVPIIAHLDLADAVERAPIFWRVKSDLERFGVSAERRAELFRRVGLSQMRPLLSRDRQLWVAGKQDMYLTAEVVDRQWQAWGRPQILWIDWGHMTFPVAMGEIIDQMRTFRSRLPAKG